LKSTSITNIEQQRERERQRLRDEEERRKRLFIKKDHQQPLPITAIPKFEQLVVDKNNDESSRSNKPKTPTSGINIFSSYISSINHIIKIVINKLSTITPLSRLSITNQHEENEASTSKKIPIKKRSLILVSFIH